MMLVPCHIFILAIGQFVNVHVTITTTCDEQISIGGKSKAHNLHNKL